MNRFILPVAIMMLFFASCQSDQDNTNQQPTKPFQPDFVQLARDFPDSAILQENLIQYYRDSGYITKAMEHADLMIKKDSLNQRWRYILSTLAAENEDTARAIEILEKSLAINPDVSSSIFLGMLYARQGNQKALALANWLITSPLNTAAEGFFIRGTMLSVTGEKEKAIQEFDNCIKQQYSFLDAYREKALLLNDLGRQEEALKELNKAVTLKNDFTDGYMLMGKILEKLGRKSEAIKNYQTALIYDGSIEEAQTALERLK